MLFFSTPRPVSASMTFFTFSLFLLCASSAVASCVVTPKVTVALSGTSRTVPDAETVIVSLASAGFPAGAALEVSAAVTGGSGGATGAFVGCTAGVGPTAGAPQPLKHKSSAQVSTAASARLVFLLVVFLIAFASFLSIEAG